MVKERKVGLDVIRTIAICMVMATHFFAYQPVLGENLQSASWMGWVFLKFLMIVGVPLFLLLTGYLQSKRECNRKHYTSIIPVMLAYFLISAIIIVGERVIYHTEVSLFRQIVNVFDFESGYGWYVEMYLGLFLLIPFLNILYRNIERREKLWLIGILAFLSFLPSTLQLIRVGDGTFEILPDFFKNLYVFAYYYIGSYIAEYQPKPKKVFCFGTLLLTLLLETGLTYWFSKTEYAWWLFNSVASVTHTVVAVSIFLLCYDLKASFIWVPARVIAACSFEMYLLSYLTDRIIYETLELPMYLSIFADFALVFILAGVLRFFLVPAGEWMKRPMLKQYKKAVPTG